MNDESDRYYELLGVAPGASGQTLKEAYRDLAKVWHPDRFSHDPRLQQKAQEKLKEINEAYERLTSGKAAGRTRPPSAAPSQKVAPDARPHAVARRKRSPFVIPTAIVFCAAFLAALSALAPKGARPALDRALAAEQEEARPAGERPQPESEGRPAASQPSRGAERASRQPTAEASSGGASGPGADVSQLRPMPTVTVTVDAVNGLLATRDCPTVSRMTYPAGVEPRQHCAVQHKTKVAAQPESGRPKDSHLKSIGKGIAAPFKWLGGERGAGETGGARTPRSGGAQNR